MMSHDSDMAAHGEAGGRQGREALQVVSVKIIDFGLARELSSTSLQRPAYHKLKPQKQ